MTDLDIQCRYNPKSTGIEFNRMDHDVAKLRANVTYSRPDKTWDVGTNSYMNNQMLYFYALIGREVHACACIRVLMADAGN